MEKIFHANVNPKKAVVATIASDKRVWAKDYNKKKKRLLYNDKQDNPIMGYIL